MVIAIWQAHIVIEISFLLFSGYPNRALSKLANTKPNEETMLVH